MLEKEKSDKPIIGGFKKDELDAFTYGFVENAYKILKNNPEKTKKILKGIFKKGFMFGAACAFDDGRQAGYKQALDEFNEENGTNYKLVIGD